MLNLSATSATARPARISDRGDDRPSIAFGGGPVASPRDARSDQATSFAGAAVSRGGEQATSRLRTILESALAAVGATEGWLLRSRPDQAALEIVATCGVSPAFATSLHGAVTLANGSLTAWLVGERTIVRDVETETRVGPLDVLAASGGLRALHAVAIRNQADEVLGGIWVGFPEAHEPDIRERTVLDLHARMAAEWLEQEQSAEVDGASEQRYRSLVERASAGVFLTDSQGRVIMANSAMGDLLGVPQSALLRASWCECLRQHDGSRLADAASMDRPQHFECRLRRANGQCFDADVALLPFAPGSLEVVVRDISARKRPENIVRGQNRALHLLAADEPLERVLAELVAVVERESGGVAIASILLLGGDQKLHHGAAPSLPDDYNRAIDGLPIARDVGTCCAAAARNEVVCTPDIDGAPGWQAFKHLPLNLGLRAAWSMPIRGSDGTVLGTFGTYFRECRPPNDAERELVALMVNTAAIAIERRRAEAALTLAERKVRESEAFLQGVVNSSADCFKVLDLDGRLQWMSDAGQRMIEIVDFAAIRGTRLPEFYRDAGRVEAGQAIEAARAGGVGRFRGFSPTASGRPKWWDVVISPINGDDGKPQMLLSVSRDITALHSVEEALRASQEQLQLHAESLEHRVVERTARLQETVSELESFSYSISHDMRAPLRAMQSFARFLEAECGEQVGLAGRDYIRRIVAAADRMDRLIQDVLGYSRLSRAELTLERVDLHGLLSGIIESYPQFDPSVADIRIVGTLPAVLGNNAALSQCFSNLLDNAIKFVAAGTKPEITVWAEPRDGRVRVFLRDNGVGIPPNQWEKIFGMFYRIDQSKAGTGIGLSIVKKAIERMGGSVAVTSEPGRGSTFHVDVEPA